MTYLLSVIAIVALLEPSALNFRSWPRGNPFIPLLKR